MGVTNSSREQFGLNKDFLKFLICIFSIKEDKESIEADLPVEEVQRIICQGAKAPGQDGSPIDFYGKILARIEEVYSL